MIVIVRVGGGVVFADWGALEGVGECSVTCGHGTKTRQVLCQVDPLDPSGDPRVLQEEEQGQCPQERPDTHEACQLDPCPDGSNAHGMVQVEDDKDCETSEHGCCADGVTFATGPSGEGCPTPAPTDYIYSKPL
ncbi:uncharacterized protein LOC143296176 [Babylonia areolata]|uniref:uncharacterized protein LOC143296176 n=1 Tax=Babylonia areolata TaxID=304850 RepID=UPI003FD14CE0